MQPTPALTAEVIWRGQLKKRHPATALACRLHGGFGDCCREANLQAT